jgi:tRNA(Ile)-lysidine synthase
MDAEAAVAELAAAIRRGSLIEDSSLVVALVSGGPDSACLAAGLVAFLGPERVTALHLNYGLRDDSDADQRTCEELCRGLGIDVRVERPKLAEGNVQAAAREARYGAAESLRADLGADWVATGHTRTDLAETVIYRLATSPGRRALLGLPAQRGRLVRPLLAGGIERADARRLAQAAGLPFRDDPSNVDPGYARNRVRSEVLPVLRLLSERAEENIAETRAELAEEAALLERLAADALDAAAGPGIAAVSAESLAGLDPALRRLAMRALAERAAGGPVPLGRGRAAEIWRLAKRPEGGELDLGGGIRAVCEHGLIRFDAGEQDQPEPVTLRVPGSCRFGRWELRAEVRPAPVEPSGPELATLDAARLGEELVVRAWRDGDRIAPLGLGGTKSLQDLFTDLKVPRSLRRTLPLVTSGDRIAWVAGVAVSEEFKLTPAAERVAVLRARVAGPA